MGGKSMTKLISQSRLLVCAALAAGLAQAGTIQYQIEPLSGYSTTHGEAYRFSYQAMNLQLDAYQELDIRFAAATFYKIFNPITGPGVDVLLFQPNNPPGAAGDLSILSLVDGLNLMSFSVDAIVMGPPPRSLAFLINEYDPVTGEFLGVVSQGNAVLIGIPEPSISLLVATGLLWLGALSARKRS